jgi:hypothetical protein
MSGTRRFKVKEKLAPRYVGPFKIIDRKGKVAYQQELPPQLSDVHDVFHVSQLKKCLRVLEEQLLMEELDLGGDLTYSERPIKILDIALCIVKQFSESSGTSNNLLSLGFCILPLLHWILLAFWMLILLEVVLMK